MLVMRERETGVGGEERTFANLLLPVVVRELNHWCGAMGGGLFMECAPRVSARAVRRGTRRARGCGHTGASAQRRRSESEHAGAALRLPRGVCCSLLLAATSYYSRRTTPAVMRRLYFAPSVVCSLYSLLLLWCALGHRPVRSLARRARARSLARSRLMHLARSWLAARCARGLLARRLAGRRTHLDLPPPLTIQNLPPRDAALRLRIQNAVNHVAAPRAL